ncbi:MAG: PilZ domain-containing protein [Treponema sp.]|jgi:c-di-GMP-binding flagellar brake protein YcgR|nr:PilZ domain-containing protein [Treponema sp.]
MTHFILLPHLLQVDITNFTIDSGSSPKEFLVFFIVFGALIALGIIISAARKGKSGKKGTGSEGGLGGFFSTLALHRLGRNIGLNREQIKMLDFVFKTDGVTDPEKSINTTSLLDRHFRRAFRVIEQSSNTDEEAQNRLSLLFSTRNVLENTVSGGMTSTRQIKDDTNIILNAGKEKYNTSVITAKTDHLTLECPLNAFGSPVKMSRGDRISALLFNKSNKGFSFETKVSGYSTYQGLATLLLAHSNHLKFLSQRRFRRRQMVIACNLFLVYVEGSGKKQRLIVDKRRLTGNIADISVGGCSIRISAPIQVGARLKIEFKQGASNVAALGQVLRSNRSGAVTVIHIRFLKVSRKSMNIINAFVYEYAHE